ncbi:Adaptin amino-terminal region protein [Ceratobasidium theobromae]|uniref:Adaptin amino-terminal region protein n=1 Tax=Ceratobasidium theobromae TaxID=1582974 RepID=A0A5N5QHK0_9AGAM|nr:Adaptin amino-terminal region protein [Ceratobasidium theobromae]
MDSYLKSSAVNRHHYALVHKVENASSVQEADEAIWSEVARIRTEVGRGLANARDELVILMYCYIAAIGRPLNALDLEFALPPAVNLAATGRAIKDRRIGLNFCAQFMSSEHPLQLMLVNTLRKELESEEPARMVLALDFIAACPSQFLAPAVAPRLEVLLGHKLQNLRHRTLLALRSLDTLINDPTDSYLSHYAATIMRRLTRAAREDHVRSDEIGAMGALLLTARDLLQAGVIHSKDAILPVAAVLEKTILAAKIRPPRLVAPILATLQVAVECLGNHPEIPDDLLSDLAKLATRVIFGFADRAASPPVLQAFRLLGALPVRLVHTLFQPNWVSLESPGPSKSLSSKSRRHPVTVLRPLIVSRDPNERWTALACLKELDVCLWAGVPLNEGKADSGNSAQSNLIPPVLDEWEVDAVMRGLSDQDKTIRKLVRPPCPFPALLLTPPPAAATSTFKLKGLEALEVLAFLHAKDGAEFARGIGRILDIMSKWEPKEKKPAQARCEKRPVQAVDEKLVEGAVLVVHESDQTFRSEFANAMFERLERLLTSSSDSLISPIAPPANCSNSKADVSSSRQGDASRVDPTTILLFATTVVDVSVEPRQAVDILVTMMPGRGAGLQEVLLLAALRLVPQLHQQDVKHITERVEEFSRKETLSRHMRRRCELFLQFVQDIDVLRNFVDETRLQSLPEFLQKLLSRAPTPSKNASLSLSPETSTQHRSISPRRPVERTISPEFSTVSLSNSPALRYDAYAPPQPAPRRNRPKLDSQLSSQGESGNASTSSEDLSFAERSAGMESDNHAGGHLRLEVLGSKNLQDEPTPNPNADLITLSALESPFRAETDFRTLSMSDSDPIRRASGSTTTSSPRFHTAVMSSPHLNQEGGELSPSDADAIWSSFDSGDGSATTLGRQTLRGWCERTPESVGNALRGMDVGFVTQKVGSESAREKEVFAFIPTPVDSSDAEVAQAVVRLKPADDGSCLWMLRTDVTITPGVGARRETKLDPHKYS